MGDTLAAGVGDEKEFAAPDAAVEAVTGAVPGHAEHRRLQCVLGHAGQDVGDVMLDGDDAPAPGLRHSLPRELRREILRMRVGGDDFRGGLVEGLEICDHPSEGPESPVRLQIADVLAEEHLGADRECHGVLQMGADG